MNNTPLLSICIATLNRCDYLVQTVEKFSEQMIPGVEVVVFDGGSTDGTPLALQALAGQYPWLKYLRQSVNSGLDQDYDQCVRQANGQYAWLFSDDDWPTDGALEKIVDACGQGHSFIFVDAEIRDKEMREILHSGRLKLAHDSVLDAHQMDQIFVTTAPALSFIGSCVLKRELWLRCDLKPFYGWMFPHLPPLFDMPLPNSACLLSRPMVSIRQGNATWTAKSFKIWMFLWPEIIWKLNAISASAKQKVTPRHPWKRLSMLMWQRAKGVYDYSQYKNLLKPLASTFLDKTALLGISIIPGEIALVVALIGIKHSQKSQRFLVEELKLSRFYRPGVMDLVARWASQEKKRTATSVE